jgi:hypothetical protein
MITLVVLASLTHQVPTTGSPEVRAPDISADRQPLGNEKKFFVFHRPSTSLEEALSDLRFCFRYTAQEMWSPPPDFVPWDDAQASEKREAVNSYGVVGAMLGAAVQGGLERSVRQINMTACMLPRGYNRYRVSERMWQTLNGKDVARAIKMQAQIASGPVPSTPKVVP